MPPVGGCCGICIILHARPPQAYRPDLVDWKKCGGDGEANLNQAFTLADSELGIPKLLDAEDMIAHKPDEKSVMTYISFFWKERL